MLLYIRGDFPPNSMAKSKSMAIKSKTDEMRAKVVVFSLLKDKRLSFGGISHKIHALLGGGQNQEKKIDDEEVDDDKAIVLYNNSTGNSSNPTHQEAADTQRYLLEYYGQGGHEGEDDKYPDLTHSLFEEFDDDFLGDDPNASVIDLVRNSKEEEGEDFKLEDEIDHVADLFIKKFHKRVRMQKLESFKRYQDMLDRSIA
ncbi:hypothetical protein LIER_12006 [Lithospermum erythrorhizon]|uniref:Uncharacterized protein n=1 Tax=Lithospermum erythrorhizon TaxID=34254 RepID=A0AAV3PSH6_LITER